MGSTRALSDHYSVRLYQNADGHNGVGHTVSFLLAAIGKRQRVAAPPHSLKCYLSTNIARPESLGHPENAN